jgi:3-keto-disaccharide hydrolase
MSIRNYSAGSTPPQAKLLIQLALLVSLNCGAYAAEKSATHVLFTGRDLAGWRRPTGEWMVAGMVSIDRDKPKMFSILSGRGVLVNGAQGRTVNLISEFEHGDVEAHIEFCVPKDSNSGVYFQGRYEVQILDSWAVEHPKYSDCGGIYERWKDNRGYEGHAPRINASKRPGEWQTFDIIFRAPRFDAAGKKIENARFVKVVHNGKVIHENVEVTGPTRAATYESNEKAYGPLMLQGDHGPVAFRMLRLKSIQLP